MADGFKAVSYGGYQRLFEVLTEHVPPVEPYSIAGIFLDLDGFSIQDRIRIAFYVHAAGKRIAKIPTCIGIGSTEIPAKLANKLAKEDRTGQEPATCGRPINGSRPYLRSRSARFVAWAAPRSKSS